MQERSRWQLFRGNDGSYFSLWSILSTIAAIISGDNNGVIDEASLSGDLAIHGTSSIHIPNPHFIGNDSFWVTVTDDQGYTTNQVISIVVNPVDNGAAIISGDNNGVIDEDTSLSGDLDASDPDGLADGSYFSISTYPSHGTSSIHPTDGNWTYIPNPHFIGNDSFWVTVTDDQGFTTNQVISIVVNPVDNGAAIISGDNNGVINEDTSLSGDLDASDPDGLADGSYFSISTYPSHGTSSIHPTDGNWTYIPNPHFIGNDSFWVTVTDDQGYTTNQVISIVVNPVDNGAAIISGDNNGVIDEDTSLSGDLDASDPDGLADGSYFSISTYPSHGTSSIHPTDGNWTYIPNPHFIGNDSFWVTVTDDQGFTTNQVISIVVNPVDNGAAIISGDNNGVINEDSSLSGDLDASDPDGLADGSYFSISTYPSHGTSSIHPIDGNWTYIPNPHFIGNDSFWVTVTDDQGYTTNQVISIVVNPVDNGAAIISGDNNGVIDEDTSLSGDLDASDPDGLADGSYFSISTYPSHGTSSIHPIDGNWTYIPNPHFIGNDSFWVTVTDDQGFTTNQVISIVVNPVDNGAAIISGDNNGVIDEDTSLSGDLDASDPDGLADGSYFSISTYPIHGTSSIHPTDGNWTYIPNPHFIGNDSFWVTVTDDQGFTTNQVISIVVNPVDNGAAIISGDNNGVIDEDTSLSGDLDASDPDGLADGSYFSISTYPSHGTSSIHPTNGNWTYIPNPHFIGNDSFWVTVTDDQGYTTNQVISIVVNPVDNGAAIISGDNNGVIDEDTSLSGDLDASDPDGLADGSYFSISTYPSHGTSSIHPTDGNWTYIPNPHFIGNDSFWVTVTDDQGYTTNQVISIVVNPVNNGAAIISGDNNGVIDEDTSLSGDLDASDPDGLADGSYFSISTYPSHGTSSIHPIDGNWTYIPNPHFIGNDSFWVTVTDDQGYTTNQVISIVVNPVNNGAAIISGDNNGVIDEDTSLSGDLDASDPDGLADGSYFPISTYPSHGTSSIHPIDGNWTYIPNPDFIGNDSFWVTVTDDQGYTTNQEISIVVNPVDNGAAIISGDNNGVIDEDTSLSGDLDASDPDGLADGSYFSISTYPSHGTSSIHPTDGNWTYIPNTHFIGNDSFWVTVTDDQGYNYQPRNFHCGQSCR